MTLDPGTDFYAGIAVTGGVMAKKKALYEYRALKKFGVRCCGGGETIA